MRYLLFICAGLLMVSLNTLAAEGTPLSNASGGDATANTTHGQGGGSNAQKGASNEGLSILEDTDRNKSVVQKEQQNYTEGGLEEYRKSQEQHRFYMVLGMIVVTPVFLLILLYFIGKSNDYTEHAIIHASGLVLIIQATAIVVVAVPTTEQLTAAIGVLAAIAGYLFGTARKPGKES